MTRTTYVRHTPEGPSRKTVFRVRWDRLIGVTIVGLIMAGGVWWVMEQLPQTYPPCLTEDQTTACYWDAPTMGNGIGRSFIVHDDGSVEYTD